MCPPGSWPLADDGLPTEEVGGEDLPSWEVQRGARLPAIVSRFVDAVRQDTYTSVVAASAACLLMVLGALVLLQSC